MKSDCSWKLSAAWPTVSGHKFPPKSACTWPAGASWDFIDGEQARVEDVHEGLAASQSFGEKAQQGPHFAKYALPSIFSMNYLPSRLTNVLSSFKFMYLGSVGL